jgi:hypothetical protein
MDEWRQRNHNPRILTVGDLKFISAALIDFNPKSGFVFFIDQLERPDCEAITSDPALLPRSCCFLWPKSACEKFYPTAERALPFPTTRRRTFDSATSPTSDRLAGQSPLQSRESLEVRFTTRRIGL